jgi:hypothetical protein
VGATVAAILALGLAASVAWAHGGGNGDDDRCRLAVGPYHVHFAAYQPDGAEPGREYCREVPATGRTVIVLDYLDAELRDLLTEVRIVRDTRNGTGRGADTIAHLPPTRYPTGSVAIERTFSASGHYLGHVTVAAGEPFTSSFRFTVGMADYTTYYLIAGAVAAGLALYVYAERKRTATRAVGAPSTPASKA